MFGWIIQAGDQERRGKEILCSGSEGIWYGCTDPVERQLGTDIGNKPNLMLYYNIQSPGFRISSVILRLF